MRITIQVATRDRHSELGLLLQSLRTQIYKEFDIIILDDASGMKVTDSGFLMALINRIKLENHKVKLLRNDFSNGVCAARNKLIESDTYNNELVCRLDDDVILEPDYLERLINVINKGYDIASGVTPLIAYPELKRENKFIGHIDLCNNDLGHIKHHSIINKHTLNKKGELIEAKDECGYCYVYEGIYPTHEFRSNALYKKEITDKGVRYLKTLTHTGFREERIFSYQAQILDYRIGVDVQAVVYHFSTPSGGVRSVNYAENVALDEQTTNKWIKKQYKKHGDFLK